MTCKCKEKKKIISPKGFYLCIPLNSPLKDMLFTQPVGTNIRTHQATDISGLFSVDEFHYLNVPLVGIFLVYDDIECTLKCLQNPSCLSVNLALGIRLWCELLSSDKYSDPEELQKNKSSYHFYIVFRKDTCAENPCKSNATCQTGFTDKGYRCLCPAGFKGARCEKDIDECTEAGHNCKPTQECKNSQGSYQCICRPGYYGEDCNTSAWSCKEAHEKNITKASGKITLLLESKPVPIFCHKGNFGCGDGGWTPVMKINGSQTTFHYDSHYWTDKNEYNPLGGQTAFDKHETKLSTYWNTPFSKICLGMKFDQQLRFTVISKQADSLYSLIADGKYRNTSLGRDTWKALIGSKSSLQPNCNREGFNAQSKKSGNSRARIGILGNDANECKTSESRIGFGTGEKPHNSITCGNTASGVYRSDNGARYIRTMGYILVQ